MYEWISGLVLGVFFLLFLRLSKVTSLTENLFHVAADSLRVIGSKKYTDLEKEKRLQKNALPILFRSLIIVAVVFLDLMFACLFVYLCWMLFYSRHSDFNLSHSFASWQFVLSSIIGSTVFLFFSGKLKKQKPVYSLWQRMLHKMAFASLGIQTSLIRRSKEYKDYSYQRGGNKGPVFITGLPRAGTTILLKALYSSGLYASLTYKNMPFPLLPRQWSKLNKWFLKNTTSKPRPHGDGILVSINSPEALDETVWRVSREEVESEDREMFMRVYANKVLTMEKGAQAYLSKNNALLNHLETVKATFPDSIVLCLFRKPFQQAISLWKQHLHFLKLQESDPFALEYMDDIGQNYFGKGIELKSFGAWPNAAKYSDPLKPNFWLEYWIAAYRLVLHENANHVHFISYERLCESPLMSLKAVMSARGLEFVEGMDGEIGQKGTHSTTEQEVDAELLETAMGLYTELQLQELTWNKK